VLFREEMLSLKNVVYCKLLFSEQVAFIVLWG